MQKTRKLISMLLAVMMVLSMCTIGMMSASALPENAVINDVEGNDASSIDGEIFGLMGDADLNDKINVRDATEIQKSAAKLVTLSETAEALADVDLNDKVNVKDATAIQKWIAKIAVDMPINCLVYIPEASAPTEPSTAPSEPSTGDEPTAPSTPAETEPKPSVPVIIPTTTATEPTKGTDATEPSQGTEPTKGTDATEPSQGTEATKPSQGSDASEATTVATVPAPQTVTIYFTNGNNWDDVNIYYWGGTGAASAGWPGQAMTYVETNDWNQDIYSYELPADVEGVVFNGKESAESDKGNDYQTVDVKEGFADNAGFYPAEQVAEEGGDQGKWTVGTYTYEPVEDTSASTEATTTDAQPTTTDDEETEPTTVVTAPASDDEPTTAPATQATTTATQPADDNTTTVYFTNNKGWEVVNVHAWNDDGDITTWPGVAMEYYNTNGYGQDIYKYTFDVEVAGVVFNGKESAESDKGNDYQTVSIKGDALVDGYGYYPDEQNEEGKWTVDSWVVEEKEPESSTATKPATTGTTAAEIETPVASDPSESTPVAVASNYAIRGTFTDWGSTDAINFVAGSNTVIEATYELEAGEYEFKIYNIATETWYGNGSSFDDECENWGFRTDRDNGILVATGGTYKFTIDVSDETRLGVTVTKVTNEDPTEATSSTAAETEPASSTTAETEPTSSTAAETEPVRVASDYAIRGTFTDWGSTDAIYFVAGSTTVIEAVYEIEAGSHPFKLYNMETSTWYGNGSSFDDECENWGFRSDRDNGILVATGGTYKITVDISDDTRLGVTVTKISDTDPTEPASSTAAETEPASSTAAETEPTSSTAAETEPTTPVVKNVTITFKDGTSSGWIDEAGAKIYLYDEDAKKEYLGTAGTGVWTFEIPETVTNISFYRVQTSFSTTSFWNSWTTAVSKREASFVTFTATENNAGSWNGEGVKMYLRGSFNSWDAGTAMTANADGTYSVDYELAVGNYEYKIATSDWSVGYPAQNATLNVTTAGTYRFVLDGTTVSATLVS